MTDKRQSDALRLADELEDSLESHDGSSLTARCQGIADDAAAELRRQSAEIETLRTGYEAARLEIESLKAQQPGAVYAELPEPITYQIAALKSCEHGDALVGWRVEPSRQSFDASMRPKRKLYTEGNMHDFADRTHALRSLDAPPFPASKEGVR